MTRAFRLGVAIGTRIRAFLVATRDTLDDALSSPAGAYGEVPEAMTRAQLIRAFKREREHALDLERDLLEVECLACAAPDASPPLVAKPTIRQGDK